MHDKNSERLRKTHSSVDWTEHGKTMGYLLKGSFSACIYYGILFYFIIVFCYLVFGLPFVRISVVTYKALSSDTFYYTRFCEKHCVFKKKSCTFFS